MAPSGAEVPGRSPKVSSPKPYTARPPSNGGHPPPFWASWGANFNKQSTAVREGAGNWFANFSKNSKSWKPPKWEMPVHVDVDFIGPFFLTMKRNAKDIWVRLPPPVQQGLPYVGAATGTGLIVWKIQAGRIRKEKAINDKLQTRVESLLEEREKLQDRVKDLKGKAFAPKSPSELKMAAAVAEATTAAAAAASAAASAASRCSVIVRRPDRNEGEK